MTQERTGLAVENRDRRAPNLWSWMWTPTRSTAFRLKRGPRNETSPAKTGIRRTVRVNQAFQGTLTPESGEALCSPGASCFGLEEQFANMQSSRVSHVRISSMPSGMANWPRNSSRIIIRLDELSIGTVVIFTVCISV